MGVVDTGAAVAAFWGLPVGDEVTGGAVMGEVVGCLDGLVVGLMGASVGADVGYCISYGDKER